MNKIFNSIGHAFAWVLSVAIPKATTTVEEVQSVVGTPAATAIAALAGTKGTTTQANIEAIAGDVLSAFENAGQAISAGGLNIQFDTATIAAIKQTYNDVKAAVTGVKVQVATPIATPIISPANTAPMLG